MIQLQGVKKSYSLGAVEVPVLKGVDLRVAPGEFVMILGRSGSGKSTLLNLLGCLDLPDAGDYRLDGREVGALDDDSLSRLRRDVIGFVFQAFHLLRGLSVLDNVLLPTEYTRTRRSQARTRALELLRRVGLGHRLGHLPRQLSGGERQRVAVARSLINGPRVLLADEPTGNLDSRARQELLDLIRELHVQDGLTVVMVTHDREITPMADRCVELVDGRVQAEEAAGPAPEVRP